MDRNTRLTSVFFPSVEKSCFHPDNFSQIRNMGTKICIRRENLALASEFFPDTNVMVKEFSLGKCSDTILAKESTKFYFQLLRSFVKLRRSWKS